MYVQYDDVTVSLIPASAQAVLGYTDGRFANRTAMKAMFPKAKQTFLCVQGTDFTADGVDSEKGDASIEAVVAFCHAKIKMGKKPIAYTFLAQMQEMANAIFAAGIPRDQVLFMCAHVTEKPHICGPECGLDLSFTVDATQWTFTALGRSLDESLCTPEFFERDLVPPAPVDPHHYLWFAKHRELVERYDALRRHPLKNRKKLREVRSEINGAAETIAKRVIATAKKSHKPRDWSTDRAGWRYTQLIHRANGKRVVK